MRVLAYHAGTCRYASLPHTYRVLAYDGAPCTTDHRSDQFIAHISVERGLARATVRAYESDLRRYLSWLAHTRGITDPDAIGKADIEEYVAQLDSDGDSARSKARRLASIHEFHRFALAQHAVSDDVSATVKAPKSAQMLPDVLTIDEVSRLLDAIPDPHGTDAARGRAGIGALPDAVLLRDRALLEFMYATGCRVSEAVGMNLDDIDIDDAHVARLTGKGSKQRLVPLGEYACRALRRYLAEGRGTLEGRAKGTPERRAVFLNKRGRRLSRQSVWEVIKLAGGAGRHRSSASPAHAPALFRHAPDPGRRRRAHRAGTARPCLGHHHADIHARQPGDLD